MEQKPLLSSWAWRIAVIVVIAFLVIVMAHTLVIMAVRLTG